MCVCVSWSVLTLPLPPQVRPFTLGQLKELLKRTGSVLEEGFWIDKIKSHCFVTVGTPPPHLSPHRPFIALATVHTRDYRCYLPPKNLCITL